MYIGDPNSSHQLWSRWTFVVHDGGRLVPKREVELNAARWLRAGFGTAGRARVLRTRHGWLIECVVEGPPAHDPAYVASVRRQFQQHFVERGFGPLAWSRVRARVLAGDTQDGRPRAQMIELPVQSTRFAC